MLLNDAKGFWSATEGTELKSKKPVAKSVFVGQLEGKKICETFLKDSEKKWMNKKKAMEERR